MKLGALLGWGVVIYAILSLVWSGMTEYGWTDGVLPFLGEVVTLLVVCMWAGSALKFRSWKDVLPYSIGWALIAAALDAVFIVPLNGLAVFTDVSTWGGYLLIALVPLLSTTLLRHYAPHGAWES
ncbi:MAG TPA: hypothetical protein VMH91_03915 [Candidatus Paceibacterota bacterium]|nr:hypothetical protein [Candidatus Paceibacterota bacterium]